MDSSPVLPVDDAATVWVRPWRADAQPLLLLMHGYGADQRDLVPLAQVFPAEYAVASIRAPLPLPQGGHAWFPIGGDPGTPPLAVADAATAGVLAWLESAGAAERTGPIVAAGFSQGGAMVTHLLRHAPESFAAGVVLSGFSVPGSVDGDARLARLRPPVFWGYDPTDPIVPGVAFGRTRAFLSDHVRLTERTYGVGHGIGMDELADVAAFLAQVRDLH